MLVLRRLLAKLLNGGRTQAAAALSSKGARHLHARDYSTALKYFRAALVFVPDYRPAHAALGVLYEKQGDVPRALRHLLDALEMGMPERGIALIAAKLLSRSGNLRKAEIVLRRLARAYPADGTAALALAEVLRKQRAFDEATRILKAPLDWGHEEARARYLLAQLYYDSGFSEEALAQFKASADLRPSDASVASAVLFHTLYTNYDKMALFREHELWGERFARSLSVPLLVVDPDPGRQLRIGYVSADFKRSSAALFIQALFSATETRQSIIVGYQTATATDAMTTKLRGLADEWCQVDGLSDEELCQKVRGDRIDILIDLNGHTTGNRLATFARRCAPVQATYLGYGATTGVAEMDWRITDRWVDPPGDEEFYSERVARLPNSLWCFTADPEAPGVTDLPALRKGVVTFGSFNHVAKLSVELLTAWGEILAALPASRLMVVGIPEGEARKRVTTILSNYDISEDRLLLFDRVPLPRFYELHGEVDIVLDTFPYTGGATTCNALWQGIPVVTLKGEGYMGRSGVSLLMTVGLPEWIAANRAEYVMKAVRLARDLRYVASLRSRLREKMRRTPLCDAASFVRDLETLYRAMWQERCAR